MIKELWYELKKYGIGVAWYNFKFLLAVKMLNAKKLTVVQFKKGR